MKTKIGRNSPCPCGCGRKFKVCNAEKHHEAEVARREAEIARRDDGTIAKKACDAMARITSMVMVFG